MYDHNIGNWIAKYPALQQVCAYQPVFWTNDRQTGADEAFANLSVQYPRLNESAVKSTQERLQRFASLITRLFPETAESMGIIESKTVEINGMKHLLESQYSQIIAGRLLLKCDSHLPVAGSVKARGGIYAVLKHAEGLAMINGILEIDEDYAIMAEPYFRQFFDQFYLVVGSTGNLGLSVGITGAALGFKTIVHMPKDAMDWKKDLLRSLGVQVVEHAADYSRVVEAARKESRQDPKSYFIDDENSVDLFWGYSVAALRLKEQLAAMEVAVDHEHPLFVYLPCGVGGAPGGICFGLKMIFGDHVHCFFAEPTHSPCMLIGLMTGENNKLSVFDLGLDNITAADGLAVGRPSGFVGKVVGELVSGVYTVDDDDLFRLLALLEDSEHISIEPSAAPGLLGPVMLAGSEAGRAYMREHNLEGHMKNAVHIAWATGGLMIPEDLRQAFCRQGKQLLQQQLTSLPSILQTGATTG